jgi:flagellar basal-body rod protein FlgB
MDLSRIPLFDALVTRMAWLGERRSVLAQNVANADWRGYTAKDLKPPSFAALVSRRAQRLPLRTTAPGHLFSVARTGSSERVAQHPDETALNGDAVRLQEQMMKISERANEHALTTSLDHRQIGLPKLVVGQCSG